MGCLNCFGGSKKVRRAESPESARAPLPRGRVNMEAFDEKTLIASRKPSSAVDYEHHEGVARSSTGSKGSMQEKSVAASDKTKSDVLAPPSPLIEFVFDIPASQQDKAESHENERPEESKEVPPAEPSTSTDPAEPNQRAESPTVPPSLAPPSSRLPQRTSSAASSINSKPRSRRSPSPANSTKAITTPIHSPVNEVPTPNENNITATTNPSSSQIDANPKQNESTITATTNPPISPVGETLKSNEPTIKLITTPPNSSIDDTPESTKTTSTTTKSDSEKLIEASSSPTTTTTTIATATSPADIKTTPLLNIDTKSTLSPQKHRPSFESDTPLTPSTSAKLNNLNRISTAPPEPPSSQALKKAASNSKRKSRVSRFFSVKEASAKRKSAFPVVAEKVDEVVPVEPRRAVSKRKEGEKGEDQGLEKEVGVGLEVDIGPKVEGRKWKEDADNDSLFCY